MTYALENKGRKKQTNVIANEMKVLRKVAAKTKIDKITSQQMREYYDIQSIEWVQRRRRIRRREWG
jgi:hypothetical protein